MVEWVKPGRRVYLRATHLNSLVGKTKLLSSFPRISSYVISLEPNKVPMSQEKKEQMFSPV